MIKSKMNKNFDEEYLKEYYKNKIKYYEGHEEYKKQHKYCPKCRSFSIG